MTQNKIRTQHNKGNSRRKGKIPTAGQREKVDEIDKQGGQVTVRNKGGQKGGQYGYIII